MEKVWEEIAESWHSFRQKPLRVAEECPKIWPKGKILDIGCGNCRNLLPFARAEFECYGIDSSKKMLELAEQFAKKHKFNVKLKHAFAHQNPFHQKFDYCFLVRVLPVIKDENERLAIISNTKESLKGNGRALITVWNRAYPSLWFKKHRNVPWSVGSKKYMRDYYMFWPFEIKKLLRNCGFKILRTGGFFEQEYWVEVGIGDNSDNEFFGELN